MEREDARAVLSRLHAAQNDFYAGGDEGPLRRTLTADVTWTIPGRSLIAGRYRGVEAVVEYMTRRRAIAHDTLRLHPGELLVGDGDHAAWLVDGTATVGGRAHEWTTVGLYRLGGELVAECTLLALDQATFDLVWGGPLPHPGDSAA